MSRARNRDAVLKVLRKELDEDRTKTYVMEISPLGLVEMTRQNVTDGVREILTKTCPTCEGEGVVLSEETVALETERRLRDLVKDDPKPEAYLVQVHPRVSSLLLAAEAGRPLLELEREVGKHFHFEGSEGLPLDWFELVDTGTREEIEQRALPFREGEELLVRIEEPHMYDEDAAVGKIDSYVISVAGAGRLIGEERLVRILVRITEVGRSSASAEIVGGTPAIEEGEDGTRPQRRRGRRGGRGRRPKSGAPSE
jgi:ribonuclease G